MDYHTYRGHHFASLLEHKQRVIKEQPQGLSHIHVNTPQYDVQLFATEILDGVALDFGTYKGDFADVGFSFPKKNCLFFGFMRSGSYRGDWGNKDFYIPQGKAYMCSPDYGAMQCLERVDCYCVQVSIDINHAKHEVGRLLRNISLGLLYENVMHEPMITPSSVAMKSLLSRINQSTNTDMLRCIVLEFLIYMYETVQNTAKNSGKNGVKNAMKWNYLEVLKSFIQNRIKNSDGSDIDEELQLKALSERFGICVSKLTKDFKDNYHISIYQFIKECKMNESARLLAESRFNVSDVAYHLGYINVSAFCKNFKAHFGKSPKHYQNIFCKDKDI